MIEHLIFDFDGTISDSYPVFVRIVRALAKDRGMTLPQSDEEIFQYLKINAIHCLDQVGITDNNRMADFHRYQAEFYQEFPPFPEIEDILKRAVDLGKKNYIYTHSGKIVHEMLKHMGLYSYFTFILDASYGFPSKPAPDALNFLVDRFQLSRETCLMIGDRPMDTRAGANAGMGGCLWDAYGQAPEEKVEYKISRLSELRALIERI